MPREDFTAELCSSLIAGLGLPSSLSRRIFMDLGSQRHRGSFDATLNSSDLNWYLATFGTNQKAVLAWPFLVKALRRALGEATKEVLKRSVSLEVSRHELEERERLRDEQMKELKAELRKLQESKTRREEREEKSAKLHDRPCGREDPRHGSSTVSTDVSLRAMTPRQLLRKTHATWNSNHMKEVLGSTAHLSEATQFLTSSEASNQDAGHDPRPPSTPRPAAARPRPTTRRQEPPEAWSPSLVATTERLMTAASGTSGRIRHPYAPNGEQIRGRGCRSPGMSVTLPTGHVMHHFGESKDHEWSTAHAMLASAEP